ncbi:uncharacterized protein [Sinocyclocheilus grahami]|uniref:uncharacterized protein isoform X2 n=1 Tax=Sinocyclocheilus grahami TaxID=75366 RepID=UPI0007AC54AC|nr:PREDICTED: uncharacterized protein LOC107548341 isoform X2 [Sinocyclocheilus grahami]
MSGKVWTLITAVSFITYIHDVQSGCMQHDVKAHLDDLLLEEHVFEIKVFSPETKLDKNFTDSCANLNCTDAYTVRRIDTNTFGEMYKRSCDGSVSDLKCPSKSTTINPTTEFSSAFLTTVSLITTDHESTTALTTVSQNITASENLTAVSSARTETIIQALKDDNQNLWAAIKACSGLLVVSFLLNIVLLLMVVLVHRNSKKNIAREVRHNQLEDRLI